MRASTLVTVVVAIAMVSSMALAGVAAQPITGSTASTNDTAAHGGSHVEFETANDAIVDYRVDGEQVISTVEVESASEAEARLGLSLVANLAAVTDVAGANVTTEVESDTRVSMTTESGATIDAHDSVHGQLVIQGDGETDQVIGANLSAEATAEQEDDSRVVVSHEDGSEGTFIVIGEGSVTVNDEGNVTAHLEGDATLTYRQYEDRNDTDDEHEQLIADGTAAAEVYLSTDAAGEAAADVITYAEDTSVEVTTYAENEVEATVERTESEGRIVIMSLSETAFETADDLTVEVDGEAAAEVETMSELEAAAAGGDEPAYRIAQSNTASAGTEAAIALDHFSERDVAIASADGDEADADDSSAIPGFGIAIGLMALLGAALIAARRHR